MTDVLRSIREHRRDVLDNPKADDNLEVRKALIARVDSGEITLEEAQRQVRKLKRARKAKQRRGEL